MHLNILIQHRKRIFNRERERERKGVDCRSVVALRGGAEGEGNQKKKEIEAVKDSND